MVSIAPVIALSVATRVQSRRLELATQAARTYIDGVRSGKSAPPAQLVPLGEITDVSGNLIFNPQRELRFAIVPAPRPATAAFIANCQPTPNDPNDPNYPFYCRNTANISLYCVDTDNDSKCTNTSSKDLIVQAFRSTLAAPNAPTQPLDPNDDGSKGYLLGVRVYRADAFDGNALESTKNRLDAGGNKVAAVAGGTGDRYAPLVEMTTEVRGTGTSSDAYEALCKRLGGCTSATPSPTPP